MDFPKSVPNIGLVNGEFVDENAASGLPGSLIPADWGNAVTHELMNAIRAGGLDPSESSVSQLADVLNGKLMVTSSVTPVSFPMIPALPIFVGRQMV